MEQGGISAMKATIDACLDCYKECLATAMMHCLEQGGAHVEPKHFRLMLTCAHTCLTCANLMLIGSPFHAQVCEMCAQVCRQCAESCDALGGPEMQECADICRTCAAMCDEMAQAVKMAA